MYRLTMTLHAPSASKVFRDNAYPTYADTLGVAIEHLRALAAKEDGEDPTNVMYNAWRAALSAMRTARTNVTLPVTFTDPNGTTYTITREV